MCCTRAQTTFTPTYNLIPAGSNGPAPLGTGRSQARRYEYIWATLHLADIHALRASQPHSTRRFRPARGCSARQRATAKALYTVVLDLDLASRSCELVHVACFLFVSVLPLSQDTGTRIGSTALESEYTVYSCTALIRILCIEPYGMYDGSTVPRYRYIVGRRHTAHCGLWDPARNLTPRNFDTCLYCQLAVYCTVKVAQRVE